MNTKAFDVNSLYHLYILLSIYSYNSLFLLHWYIFSSKV